MYRHTEIVLCRRSEAGVYDKVKPRPFQKASRPRMVYSYQCHPGFVVPSIRVGVERPLCYGRPESQPAAFGF